MVSCQRLFDGVAEPPQQRTVLNLTAVRPAYDQGFHAGLLLDHQRRTLRAQDVRGTGHKAPGKVGKPQMAVEFEGQSHQRFGPPAVLFGLMQIAGHLQRYRNLRRQGAGPANLFLRDALLIDPVHHAEHSQDLTLGIEKRDGQQLPNFVLSEDFQVDAGDFAGIVRPEDLFVEQGPARGSGR